MRTDPAPDGRPLPGRPTDLAGVLDAVAAVGEHLRAATALDGDGWWTGDRLVAGGDDLAAAIAETAPGRGTEEPDVLAALFVQAYAHRVAGAAVAAYALGLPVPDVAPGAVAVRTVGDRPRQLAVLSTTLAAPDPDALAGALLDGHLVPLVAAVRRHVRVGERLLRGNVGTSIAKVLRAVEAATPGPEVRARSEALLAAGGAWIGVAGAFVDVDIDGATHRFWERRSCCLWYRTPAGERKCGDCSLLSADERDARRRASV